MIASIHQPMFLQYLGLFRKIAKSDIFVLYEDVQYSRGDWHNRNKILRHGSPAWLTVPVTFALGDTFLETRPTDTNFIAHHLAVIKEAYKATPYFAEIYPMLEKTYHSPFNNLAEFNSNLFYLIISLLRLETKIVHSKNLHVKNNNATGRIVDICKSLECDTYLAGMDAGYMELDQFEKANIKVMYNDFIAKPYPQIGSSSFVPNLSVIDALFNVGPDETRKLISY